MPPSLHPPHLHFHKLKRRHHPAAMAKKGLVAILYKLRDVHRPPSSPASPSPLPSTPSAHYAQRCYPPPPSAWPWPSCRHPRTSSFRGPKDDAAAVFRTANTVYDTNSEQFLRRLSIDEAACIDRSPLALPPGEAAAEQVEEEEEKEMQLRETAVVRGMRSERLFFEPAGAEFLPKQEAAPARGENEAAAVLCVKNEEQSTAAAPHKNESAAEAQAAAVKGGAVVVTVESKDPYGDFRASMAEMVAAHGLRDWEALEELLAWYLKLNAKGVHAAIVGAFIDLLVSMQPQAASPLPSPPSLPSPSPSSSCITFEEYSSATFDEEEGKS
ncbi:plant-specific domain TIGR01568 family protein [Panicum miliaceum]|uniref:Transcription repressor n=1 Tax=Panicum miliaceum TaxID=4540 RepID=A0A3L6PSH1_PANMI|nr:plant-specific domain TIGR01568 family protein [Panicum miliaceum]